MPQMPHPGSPSQPAPQPAPALPYDELVEVANYDLKLLGLGGGNFALAFDTPTRRRYVFLLTSGARDELASMLTQSKVAI